MRVLYDYQAFLQRQGGVSRYFAELLEALRGIRGFEAHLPFFYSDNEYLPGKSFLTRAHFKGKERLMDSVNQMFARHALKSDFDVFHPTYFRPYFLGRLKRPLVITIHDMVHEQFSADLIRDDGTIGNKKLLCERASRIIAVSENTKNDVCRLLGVPEQRVVVVHHATKMRYLAEPRIHERPYVLYVGARSGYKNFPVFLHAAAAVLRRREMDLLCAGGGEFTRAEKESIRSVGLEESVRHVGRLTSGELASLYHFASLFCYPSLYEGFGLPLLEAFACGCPVAASSTSSIPEVAGDAAEYFDPSSTDSMSTAMERVLSDRERTAELVAAGRKRLLSFSWEESARKTYQTYCAALGAER